MIGCICVELQLVQKLETIANRMFSEKSWILLVYGRFLMAQQTIKDSGMFRLSIE